MDSITCVKDRKNILFYFSFTRRFLKVQFFPGVYTVGNIGREMASMRIALIGAYLGLPLLWANPGNITYVAVLSAIAVKAKGTRWRDQRPQRHLCVRAGVLLLCGVLYLSLWTSAIYHNSYIRLKDGQTVKVHVAVKNFFNSPAWAETKETLGKLWEHLSSRGFSGLYDEFMLAIDPEGEHHAHRVSRKLDYFTPNRPEH